MGITLQSVGNWTFRYAYIASFVGALFLCTTQIFSIEIESFLNDTFAKFVYIFIGTSGFISILNWFNITIPYGTTVLDQSVVKINSLQP